MSHEWIDTVPVGDPEVVVTLADGDTLIGLRVLGVEGYPMLPIRLDALGRPVSFGRDGLDLDTADIPAQSNPRRYLDDENVARDHGEQ